MRLHKIFRMALVTLAPTFLLAQVAYASPRPEEEVMEVAPEENLPPSKNMLKAKKFFKRGKKALRRGDQVAAGTDFQSATIYLKKVLSGNDDSVATKQEAQFLMARALFAMGYYSASKNYFGQIVEEGESHRYYKTTLKWLVALQLKLPESAGVLPLIGKYKEDYFEDPSLAQYAPKLFYFLGRYYYMVEGQLEKALKIFEQVALRKSMEEYYIRAKIFQGVILVRLNKPVQALEKFRKVLKFAEKHPGMPGMDKYIEFTNLSLARVYYQAGRVAIGRYLQTRKLKFAKLAEKYLTLSIKFYELIPEKSPHWLQSLFEESWAYFILDAQLRKVFKRDYGGFQKALGNIHTLNAPFFENYFFPESLILKSVIYVTNCRVNSALESISEFEKVYPKLQESVREIAVKHKEDDDAYYAYIMKILSGKKKMDPKLHRLVRYQFTDKTFKRELAYLNELQHELKQLNASSPDWKDSNIAKDVMEDLNFQLIATQERIAQIARERMKRLDDLLTKLVGQSMDIRIEINNLKLKKLSAKAMESKTIQVQILNVNVDDEHVLWPFTGEYWKDELGYYRFVVYSSCGAGK